jgi:hypothetical protein
VERWQAGGTVYVAEGFTDPGAVPPFLYPPFVLPFLALLEPIPTELLRWAWFGLMVGAAVLACRRLAMPWWLVPFALAWPPFAEGAWNGNVQVLLFAAFAYAFWERPTQHDLRPVPRDLAGPDVGPRIGFLAAAVGAVKVSQAHAWLVVARHRPRSALLGALPWIGVLLVTLPLTGFGLYVDWLRQASLASNPDWAMIGVPLLVYLPGPIVAAITVASVVVAWRLRGPDTAAWLGLVMLIVSPNLHAFTGLFAIPALLLVRREIALVAVMAMASYLAIGWWLGVGLVAGAMIGGRWLPGLREPETVVTPA